MGIPMFGLIVLIPLVLIGAVFLVRGFGWLVSLFTSVRAGQVTLTCPNCGKETSPAQGRCTACGREL